MATVLVHTRNNTKEKWQNQKMEFSRIPCEGEHLVLSATSDWYQVQVVVHCPFEGAEFDSEVYATKVNHLDVMPKTDSHITGSNGH